MRDGNGGNALDEDDDHTILLDTLDDTLGPCKITVDDTDSLGDLVEEVGILQVDQVVTLYRRDPDEIVHLGIGDHDDLRTVGYHGGTVDHILHGSAGLIEHLQTGDLLLGLMDEDEVVDGRYHLAVLLTILLDLLADHGEVVLNLQTVKFGLHLELTAVSAVHGIPVHEL